MQVYIRKFQTNEQTNNQTNTQTNKQNVKSINGEFDHI